MGLSRTDVQKIVQSELANNPAPLDQGQAREQVEEVVRATMADMPETGAGVSVPRKSTPDQFTRFFVNEAVNRYESEGLDATLAYYNTKESTDGPWYVFIIDEDGTMLAHAANPDLVDRPVSFATGPNGYPAGEAVAASADEDGEWFDLHLSQPRFWWGRDQALLDGAPRWADLRLRLV